MYLCYAHSLRAPRACALTSAVGDDTPVIDPGVYPSAEHETTINAISSIAEPGAERALIGGRCPGSVELIAELPFLDQVLGRDLALPVHLAPSVKERDHLGALVVGERVQIGQVAPRLPWCRRS